MKTFFRCFALLAFAAIVGLLASCTSDDDPAPAESPAAVPTHFLEAISMLTSQQWVVSLSNMEKWDDVQGIEVWNDVRSDVDEARFCLLNDHGLLAVHVKDDASTWTKARGQWGVVKVFEYAAGSYYNLQPDSENPAEGSIYDDDALCTLDYRNLNENSCELLVGRSGHTEVVRLTAAQDMADITADFTTNK